MTIIKLGIEIRLDTDIPAPFETCVLDLLFNTSLHKILLDFG
jgi:hypothetical protein